MVSTRTSIVAVVTASVFALASMTAEATTITTVGAGSAVTSFDRGATFDSLTSNGIDLTFYTEGSLSITVPDITFVGFDAFGTGATAGFHYGNSGNTSYVTIKTTDAVAISGLEFLYGNGYSRNDVPTVWETWKGGSLVSSGSFTVARGTIVGWSDAAGFDELRVASGQGISALGQFQAIALDNVRVQLASVPDGGSTMALLGLATLALAVARRKIGTL